MREIKFRARDKKDGKWYYFTLQELVNGATQTSEFCDVEFVGWSQYVGFEDDKKQEIYFDDIVQFSFDDEESNEHFGGTALMIETMNGGAGIMHDWDDYAMELVAVDEGGEIEDIWPDSTMWKIEIIGNLSENPELLKQPYA